MSTEYNKLKKKGSEDWVEKRGPEKTEGVDISRLPKLVNTVSQVNTIPNGCGVLKIPIDVYSCSSGESSSPSEIKFNPYINTNTHSVYHRYSGENGGFGYLNLTLENSSSVITRKLSDPNSIPKTKVSRFAYCPLLFILDLRNKSKIRLTTFPFPRYSQMEEDTYSVIEDYIKNNIDSELTERNKFPWWNVPNEIDVTGKHPQFIITTGIQTEIDRYEGDLLYHDGSSYFCIPNLYHNSINPGIYWTLSKIGITFTEYGKHDFAEYRLLTFNIEIYKNTPTQFSNSPASFTKTQLIV